MELFEFAESVLYGTSLAAKLVAPHSLTDVQKRDALRVVPNLPGRPLELQIVDTRIPGAQSFPKAWELEKETKRGEVFHFFANHELLALETMALVLLKFPNAPKSFRRGIAQTMRDEQRHLEIYLSHMSRLGVDVGSVQLGGYFWNALRDLQSPYEFVLKMGLTFEQANLDFALYFEMLFDEMGDSQSAAAMREVYTDEIRHVRHSLQWFRAWKPASQSDWEAFASSLQFPLSPSRAKGTIYSCEAREAVGFDNEFIAELRLFNQSKGRPPRVFVYNPAQELEVGLNGTSFTQSKLHQEIAADLESLLVLLASPDDVLALRNRLSPTLRSRLAALQIEIPQVVVYDERRRCINWERGRKIDSLVPWGCSPSMDALSRQLRQMADPASCSGMLCQKNRDYPFRKFVSKSFVSSARALVNESLLAQSGNSATELSCDQLASSIKIARSIEEVFAAARLFFQWAERFVILKAPFGSSGQNQLRIERGGLDENQLYWIRRVLNQYGEMVVEPWRKIEAEFSIQAQVLHDKQIVVHGTVRNVCSPHGQYLASVAGKSMYDLPLDVRRYIFECQYGESLDRAAHEVGKFLAEQNYVGSFGIDSYIFRHCDGRLDVNLLGELNLRHTMGRIALELKKRSQAGRSVVLSLASIERARTALVLEHCEFSRSGSNTLISKGLFALSDLAAARKIVPLGWVGLERHVSEFLHSLHARF